MKEDGQKSFEYKRNIQVIKQAIETEATAIANSDDDEQLLLEA